VNFRETIYMICPLYKLNDGANDRGCLNSATFWRRDAKKLSDNCDELGLTTFKAGEQPVY